MDDAEVDLQCRIEGPTWADILGYRRQDGAGGEVEDTHEEKGTKPAGTRSRAGLEPEAGGEGGNECARQAGGSDTDGCKWEGGEREDFPEPAGEP